MSKGKIIVADDEEGMREFYEIVLEQVGGYELVSKVGTGEELVKVARDVTHDIIITDYNMGKGRITGIEAVRQLRNEGYEKQILLITGDGSERILQGMKISTYEHEKLMGDKVYWYVPELKMWMIQKPIKPQGLIAIVEDTFAGKLGK